MLPRHGPALLLAALLAGAVAQGAGPRDAGSPGQGGVREEVLVRRAHWPVLVEPVRGREDAAAICASLSPDQVEVLEDGAPARVTALGPRPLPRLHALLIDTSRSMLESGLSDAAREAAAEYVDSLPPDEPVLLASFDVNLVLRAPASTDRAALREAIDRLEAGGNGTALWDALYYLSRYLGTLPGEKIIVLLSDGLDSASLPGNTLERVADLAAATPNLTVFPVRVSKPGSRGGQAGRGDLALLAHRTGGEFFEAPAMSLLARVYRRIRERLEGRVYVSYAPRPFGEGPKDGRSGSDSRWRDVKVRAAQGVPCKVTGLRAPKRFEGRPAVRPGGTDAPPRFEPAAGEERLVGRARDLVLEAGPRYRAAAFRDSGKLVGGAGKKSEFATRDVVVELPSADRVRTELTSPERLLLYMLERDLPAPASPLDGAGSRPPFLVHGQTFLELREELGRALARSRPDYREWARRQLEGQVDTELERLLSRTPLATVPTPQELRHLREAMLEQAADPDEGPVHLLVAEWLRDVPAREATLGLEREVVNRVLGADARDPAVRALADLVDDRWPRLGGWFPPAFRVRILAPLIPAYDPDRDVVGFYRFLLPWPGPEERSVDPPPPRPLGLRAVRALQRLDGAWPVLQGRVELAALEYAGLNAREWERAGCPPEGVHRGGRARVTLLLVETGAADQERPLRLDAYFAWDAGSDGDAGPPPEPDCWRVESAGEASGELADLARRLAALPGG